MRSSHTTLRDNTGRVAADKRWRKVALASGSIRDKASYALLRYNMPYIHQRSQPIDLYSYTGYCHYNNTKREPSRKGTSISSIPFVALTEVPEKYARVRANKAINGRMHIT